MTLVQALELRRGVTAVIGGGGKTSLLRALGEELAGKGHTVLLCTTTKIFPFPGLMNLDCPSERELRESLGAHRLAAAGTPVQGTEKWGALELPMERLAALADYVIVEADGSAGRPMKAHVPHEPVVPAQANQTILVVGASGFGRPIAGAAHRPERYAELAGERPDVPVSPETEAAVLRAEGLHDRIYINQADTPERLSAARNLQKLLSCPVAVGALRQDGGHVLCWS
ncbi:MAG: selenium cofactor biosynthesis protein YqeC [Butyricicoccus sp.]|nr:selenium cofactor biosynthesis protein YqeC [Butyricicoccus sp.]